MTTDLWMPESSRTRERNARRALRRAVNLRCDVIKNGWDRAVPCRATDLSPYGALVELSSVTLEHGDEVVVTFEPPDAEDELTVFARVARVVHGPGVTEVGLAFGALAPDERTALEASLHGRPPPLPREPD